MERRKPSRKQTSKKKSSYKNKKLDKNSRKKSENPCSTSKTDYTSIFGLTDHTMVKKFQRESYTPDTEDDESSSEEVNPIADDNEDQAFAEYQTPERLLEPDDNIILAHLRESAREKRGIIMEELDEDKKLKKQVESSSMESKKGKEKKFDRNRSKNVDDVPEIPESLESPKDLETKLDAYLESGPNSVTSSIPSDSGKPRKKKVEEDESWKNYTVNQMIKASFIVTVEPAKNLKEGHICRLVMTKDCNGKPTENNRSPMTFTDYEFSSDSEPEENGYYFRKLYRHNPNLKQTKTKIEELKEQIAPEKFIKRIRHAITYDTKDEIGKWRKPIRKPFPSFYYPVKFVVPQGNPLTKLPKKEYNRIRGFRPRSSSVISFEQMEPGIRRTEQKIKTRRRKSCSPPRQSFVHRLCHTMMTDFILPDDRFERFDMTLDPRRFKEGRFLEDVVVMWCDYYLKMIKRARRKGIKSTIPLLFKYTDPCPKWKLDEDCQNLVAAKKWPKCSSWQSDLVKIISKILFPEEVNFMLRDEMMTYSGQVRRGAERLLNTFLQRELCTRNAMETFFILMLIKPKEFQNIQNTKNFSEKLKGMTSWVFKKGRLPFGFFDEILPKKFIPRQPMAACNYCPDAILAAVELVPSIVNIFQQDDVDVTARIERKRRSRAKKLPSESEFPDAMEDLRTLVEAEENVDPPVKAPEALVEEKPRKRGGKNMHNKKMKKPKMTEPELELMIESTSEPKHLIETTEGSEHLMDLVPESEYMMNSAEEPELSILGINRDFSPKLFSDIDIPVEEVTKARSTSFSPELGFKNEILTSTTKEVDKRSKKDTVEVVQVLEEVIPESHLEKVSKKLRLKNSEKSHVENEVSENSSEKRIPSSPDISLGEDIQQRLADEIVKDSTFSNELKLCPTSESIEKKKLPENIVVKDSESKVIKPVSKDSVKKSGDYIKEVDIQITQIPPDKEDVAVPGSSNNRIAFSEEPAVKDNIQEASSERKSIIEERLPSRIASVDPEEPVVKKRKLDPIVTLCDINEGLPPVSVGASEVVIPDENKSKTSVQVEIEEGEILDSDEEPEILFLGEKRPIQREKVQMNNLSKKIDTRRDHTKTKKDIGGRFDLQGELFDNHSKSKYDFPKKSKSSEKQLNRKIKQNLSTPGSKIQKSSTLCLQGRGNSGSSSTLPSEEVFLLEITEDPEIPEDLSSREKAVFFNSPAIRGSYTIIFSVPSKPEVKVVEESPKSKNIQKKTEFEKIEKLISLNVEEKPKSSLKSESKIEQKLKPESVFLTPDISVPEKTSRSFPKDTVSPEHRSSDIETKKNRKGHPKSLDIQTLHESNKQKEKEKKVLSLVTSNSDLLLVLREGEKKEVLDYLTSLETGLTLETPSDIRPIPFEDLVKTSRNPSSRATDIKYYHNLKEDKDQSSSLQNLDFEEIYEPNRERVVAYCKPISRGSVPCQGVRAKKSKFIFIWEHSSIGWILTKRLQKEVTLSLEKPFDTGSRIMHDYGASLSFRRGENESYIVYKCSLGECLGTAGKLQSIDGYFTAYNGKMVFLFHPEKNETWKIDWLPCISLITFSLGGQKVKELTIESYSKVFGTEKSPIPLRVVDDPGKERSFFIHKPNDRYCRILDSGDPIESERNIVEISKNGNSKNIRNSFKGSFSEIEKEKKKISTSSSIEVSESGKKNKPMDISIPDVVKTTSIRDSVEPKQDEIDFFKNPIKKKKTETVHENIEKEISSRNSKNNTVAKESSQVTISEMIIPNDDGNMQKIQKSSIKEPVPDFTEISKNPITNEFPLHKAQKCTTIPIHLPDVEISTSKTSRSREKIDEKEAMLIEEKSTTPNDSVVEAVRNIDSGNNDFREITPEVEVPPPEFLSRPPIRINLSLVPNQLASNHLMMNNFDDNEEESIPQPSESKKTQINMMRDIGITVDKRIEEIRSHMDFHRGDIEKNPLTIIDVIIVKINVTKNIIMLVTLKNGGIGTLPMTTEEVIVLKANQCPIVE